MHEMQQAFKYSFKQLKRESESIKEQQQQLKIFKLPSSTTDDHSI